MRHLGSVTKANCVLFNFLGNMHILGLKIEIHNEIKEYDN